MSQTDPTSCEALVQAFATQADFCRVLGSPFSAAVLDTIAEHIPLVGPIARMLRLWRGVGRDRLVADAVPLRLLGGLHHLVLTGAEPALAAVYPAEPWPGDIRALTAPLVAVVSRREDELAAFMRSPPQTNEVRRALCLIGGFLTVAAETGLPLSIFEIGASAGLLQNFDTFRYAPEGWTWGDPASPVVIDGSWRGSSPPHEAELRVVARRGCDQAPVDVADPAQARRLLAYIWPDQFDRLERTRAAIALAARAGTRVERADAAAWIAGHVRPAPGVATVLFHSVMWQYMPAATQEAARTGVEAAGAAATGAAPFVWLRMEPAEDFSAPLEVRVTSWPGGDERLLARVHPHGAIVGWMGV